MKLQSRLFRDCHGVHLAHEDRVIEFRGVGVLLHFFHDIDGNAYDEYAVVTLLGLEFLQERYFAAARRAPGSPEVEQTVTTVVFVEVVHLAVESQ